MTAPNVNEGATTTAPAAPAVEAPAAPVVEQDYSRESIDARTQASATEHFTQRALESVAAKGDKITVADLRALPGAEKMSDAELAAAWRSVQTAPEPIAPPANATPAQKRAWKAYNGDAEVADFSKMSAEDFLKLQYGYTANGKEHRKTLDEVFRNASNGHYNHERTQQLQQERNTALEKWRTFEQQATEGAQQRQAWDGALHAASQGNYEPMQNMLNAYVQALGMQPAAQAPAMIPAAQVEAERAGQHVYTTVVLPKAAELAQKFNVPAGEVAEAIMALVNSEAPEFLTPQRFQQIVEVELPRAIEDFIAQRPAPVALAAPALAPAEMEELVRLRDENGRFKAGAATRHNTAVDELHARRAAAPPAAPAAPGGAGGTSIPNFDSGTSAREWLRGYKG